MVNPGQGAFFVSNHIIPVRLWLRSAASIHSSPHTTIPGSTFLDSLHVLPPAGGSPFVSMPCLTTVCGRLCADECANVVLNFCYEKRNVGLFVSCGGAGLLAEDLESEDVRVQANAAGAIQSISFHPEGRAELREAGEGVCLPKIIGLLSSKDAIKNKYVFRE